MAFMLATMIVRTLVCHEVPAFGVYHLPLIVGFDGQGFRGDTTEGNAYP